MHSLYYGDLEPIVRSLTSIAAATSVHISIPEELEVTVLKESPSTGASTNCKLSKHALPSPLPNGTIVSGAYDCNGGVIRNKDGIQLVIPEGAIKAGDVVMFHTVVDRLGPFVLPSNCQDDFASPYYWIGVSGSYHFQEPVQVEFEHYGACDPSHYQLLSCEDDDESHTMRPINYHLDFKVRNDNIQLCSFQASHFCSYCLRHDYKDANRKTIGAFCLTPDSLQSLNHFTVKPDNFESMSYFSVEIWFSYNTNYCLDRNKKLYKQRGMKLQHAAQFVASSDENSTSFFTLEYEKIVNNWYIDDGQSIHDLQPKKILTKSLNFYNDPDISSETDPRKCAAILEAKEENKLFPPYFVLYVKKREYTNDTELDTIITVSLHTDGKIDKKSFFKILVPKWKVSIDSGYKILVASRDSIPDHDCVKSKLYELIDYQGKIVSVWHLIALKLEIPDYTVEAIHINDSNNVKMQCYSMFREWLKISPSPCWCHFSQALYSVGLPDMAEEVISSHLRTKQCFVNLSSLPIPTANEMQVKDDTLNINCLMRLLRKGFSGQSDGDVYYFVTVLLPENGIEVVKEIRHSSGSREDKIKKICEAFLKDDASWNRLYNALKEAGFNSLAEKVEFCYLK